MDSNKILHSATQIQRLFSGLRWLESHGNSLRKECKDSFSINVSIHSASALPGAKEAQEILSKSARELFDKIIVEAMKSIEKDLQNYRKIIIDEIVEDDKK